MSSFILKLHSTPLITIERSGQVRLIRTNCSLQTLRALQGGPGGDGVPGGGAAGLQEPAQQGLYQVYPDQLQLLLQTVLCQEDDGYKYLVC